MRPPWHPTPWVTMHRPAGGMPDPAVIFADLDKDNDKKLSLEEFATGMRRLHAAIAARGRAFASMAARAHGRGPQGRSDESRDSAERGRSGESRRSPRQGRSDESRDSAERGPSSESRRGPRQSQSGESSWW